MHPFLRSSFNQSAVGACGLDSSALGDLASSLDSVGFGALTGVVDAKTLASLSLEASQRRADARLVFGDEPCVHSAHLAKLGDKGLDFLSCSLVQTLLGSLFREPLGMAADACCYTYYAPGDCLGPHLDHSDQCRVTVILYLDLKGARQRTPDTGLQLRILETIDGGSGPVRAVLPTELGTIVVGLGSEHWHERPRLQAGEHLTALTACFSPDGLSSIG